MAVKKGIYRAPSPITAVAEKENPVKKGPEIKTETATVKNEVSIIGTQPKTSVKKSSRPSKRKEFYNLNEENDSDIIIDNDDTSYIVEQIINDASTNLGISYLGGGTSKNGFDCSGLIYSTFKKYNIELPRSSIEMAGIGPKVNPEKAKKGDLIFFINRGQKRINHVGMVVEVTSDEIKFIHSATRGGVMISSTKEPYYQKTFAQINRVVQ